MFQIIAFLVFFQLSIAFRVIQLKRFKGSRNSTFLDKLLLRKNTRYDTFSILALVAAISCFTHIHLAFNYFPSLEFPDIVWGIIIALLSIVSVRFIIRITQVETVNIEETSPI